MREIVAKNLDQSKKRLEVLLVPAIVVLIGIAAFGLGRLSALQAQKTPLSIHPSAPNSGETGPSQRQTP